ncbi:Cof-type HAD-IIB family hydrolase [Sphingomonas sp.]|uniref:Cof-type HAD-IIB family hydrolase n=1 Tax=Sphingomonas sp. TaxID=28214 RepID=UPI002D7F57B2|nr:Cof-type HAD-IIB family hydrolase [Sphingomonas sp.]
MSSFRLLVSDVDGTLVDKRKQLTAGTIQAVGRLRAAGIGFTVISARPRSGVLPIADALAIDGPIAAFNGGLIFRREGTVERRHLIPGDVARGALEAVGELAVDVWVFADDQWHASTDQGAHVVSERIAANQEPVIRGDFADLLDRADKITFVSDEPATLATLHARINAAFPGRATVALSQTYYLDVTAMAANKGAGIEALAAAAGVPLTQVVAIGDQANDIAMLKRAGLAIAMGNAPDAVKAVADQVTATNDADGVAQAIDTLILSAVEHLP